MNYNAKKIKDGLWQIDKMMTNKQKKMEIERVSSYERETKRCSCAAKKKFRHVVQPFPSAVVPRETLLQSSSLPRQDVHESS